MTARVCVVDGCSRAHSCHGYCAMHYARWRKYGEPGSAEALVMHGPHDGRCSRCDAPLARRDAPTPYRADKTHWKAQPVCEDCTRHRARVQAILKSMAAARVGLTYADYVREYGQGREGFLRAGLTRADFAAAELEARSRMAGAS